jgi:hypothetical protein
MMPPVRFVVRARAEPQTLARLINHVAQLGLVPKRVRADEADRVMTVLIEQDGLDDHRAGVIAEKMRASVLVETVRLTRGRRCLEPSCEWR